MSYVNSLIVIDLINRVNRIITVALPKLSLVWAAVNGKCRLIIASQMYEQKCVKEYLCELLRMPLLQLKL